MTCDALKVRDIWTMAEEKTLISVIFAYRRKHNVSIGLARQEMGPGGVSSSDKHWNVIHKRSGLNGKTQQQLREKWKNMYRTGKIQRHLGGQELIEFLDEWKKWRKLHSSGSSSHGDDGLVVENNIEEKLPNGGISESKNVFSKPGDPNYGGLSSNEWIQCLDWVKENNLAFETMSLLDWENMLACTKIRSTLSVDQLKGEFFGNVLPNLNPVIVRLNMKPLQMISYNEFSKVTIFHCCCTAEITMQHVKTGIDRLMTIGILSKSKLQPLEWFDKFITDVIIGDLSTKSTVFSTSLDDFEHVRNELVQDLVTRSIKNVLAHRAQ